MNNAHQETASSRAQRLEEAWGLGIQGYYDAALEILERLLGENPIDTGTLRLKGNLLELKELDLLEHSAKKLVSSADYLAARKCYETILTVDPCNVKARIDLGDHYKNLDANDQALSYYKDAKKMLALTPKDEAWKEDVQELGKAAADLIKHTRLASEAEALEEWCRQELGAPAS
jgi:tetratricopeptide (TPR) repeat protein